METIVKNQPVAAIDNDEWDDSKPYTKEQLLEDLRQSLRDVREGRVCTIEELLEELKSEKQ